MSIGYLSRAVHFSASHHYHRPDWSEEENLQRFGASADVHEHDYRCEVTVKGAIDPHTGMVIDLGELDRILESEVIARFHDRDINSDVPEFGEGGLMTTTENLAAFVLAKVAEKMPAEVSVYRVRVMEDADLWSDAYGSESP
jgi:6-pyruvoyltetrahydropterin/6-carboxytetrahydropterin synthase